MSLKLALVYRWPALASCCVFFGGAFSSNTYALTVDVVGGISSTATGSGLAKGNVFRIDTSVVLQQFESYLRFSGSETLNFCVYSNSSEFGNFTQIVSNSYTAIGAGTNVFYSSGALNAPLTAGKWYLLAVSWSGSANAYYFNQGDSQSTSFGAYVHGYASGTHPLSSTVNTTVNDLAIYYQRLTTDVPEPMTNFLGVCGLTGLAILGRRRRSDRSPKQSGGSPRTDQMVP